jgi:hypothetical protein
MRADFVFPNAVSQIPKYIHCRRTLATATDPVPKFHWLFSHAWALGFLRIFFLSI